MSRTVTVGLDGSPESLAAADWAAREALLRELPLRLLHVREPDPYPYPVQEEQEDWQHWSERIPREAAAGLTVRYPTLEITTAQLRGHAADVLAGDATTAELLVLGSRGLGGVTGFLVGSVALATLAHAPCPAVLVRAETAGRSAPTPGAGAPGGIVLGMDLGRPSDELVEFAFDAAARRGAQLTALHGWDLPPLYGINPIAIDPGLADDLAEEKARALTEVLRPWRTKFPSVEVREETVAGRPARQLLEAAADASLVVVGRRVRRSPIGWHVGPVAHALIHHSATPVAVVPHA